MDSYTYLSHINKYNNNCLSLTYCTTPAPDNDFDFYSSSCVHNENLRVKSSAKFVKY